MNKAIFGVFLGLTSCALPFSEPKNYEKDGGNSSSGSTTGGSSTGDPAGGSSTGAVDPTSDGSDADPTAEPAGFIMQPDVNYPPGFGCSTFAQDCPEGQKCTTTYLQEYNDYVDHCVEVHPQALAVGEPCQLFGESGVDGDDCVLGSLCWDPDPVTGIGMCVELCGGSEDAPECATPDTFCAFGKSLQLCLQVCDPREADACPVGCTCVGIDSSFMCVLDASGEDGAYADPCEFANACDPGLQCLASTASPECDPQSTGCCMPVCDITAPDCPHPDLECLPWFPPGEAPETYATLGYCSVPE